ncbi:hypothetical protein AGR56_07195 [Clostridium sp. DMHC 10]|uniref:hypothetical protein n=1 Tax=Clostridium sp. DMHC 10 TaxID=747377 RepID=UPI00069EEC65|nr:hypothetical protein [Clostridium sp. DMHC 10]KOF56542.1 hypothetical protein AGR56_07195 [Clostridium sp. DMHC 10]
MMNVIKTAIVTIVISIISGLLVEYFKNLAPRILCNIGNGIPIKMNNKKVYAYTITVSNLSKKIIHELSLNVQSSHSNLKIADAKITKGLKFESSIKDNILDVYIPFLSKDDKFSVTVYVENHNKPVIVMRSPENFKKIESVEQKKVLPSVFNTPKNANESNSKKTKKIGMKVPNKKEIIIITSLVLVVLAGVLVKLYFKGTATKAQTSSVETNVDKKSTEDAAKSSSRASKNAGIKSSTGRKVTNTKSSTGGTTQNTNTTTDKATGNTSNNTPTSGTKGNTNTNAPTNGTSSNGDTSTKTSTNTTTGNTDTNTKTSTGESTGNTSTSSNGASGNTGN